MELEYTPKHHYIEVYIDSVCMGCYLLTKSIEVDEERVNINFKKGDFFIELESWREEDDVYYFTPREDIRLALKEPEEPTDEQLKYYEDALVELMDALFSNNYEELCKYFDVDSFVKYYLLNEFAKTVDFPESSVNFYYKDGKLYAGPVWDFDLSSGNAGTGANKKYWDTYNGDCVFYTNYYCRDLNPIFKQLFKYKEVNERYNDYFNKYKEELKNVYERDGLLDSTINTYQNIFDRNYDSKDKGGAWWQISTVQGDLQFQPFDTYQENVDYLKDFLKNRYEWLENNK